MGRQLYLGPARETSAPPVGCPSVSAPIMAGAEPYAAMGDGRGALVLHGFTGNPQSLRGVAMALADAGLTVELPLLPGHGTEVADMLPTRWDDWSGAAEEAYTALAARCDGVVVAGLSMGGLLALWLAERHPEIAGLALVNPMVSPPDDSLVALAQSMVDAGEELAPGIGVGHRQGGGGRIVLPRDAPAAPSSRSSPRRRRWRPTSSRWPARSCVFTSTQDHVVDPVSSEVLVARATGPVEQVMLERSYHVATLDWDRDEIEARTVEFATSVSAGARHRDEPRPAVARARSAARTSSTWRAWPAST